MKAVTFKRLQKAAGKTNQQLADELFKTKQSISNYRCGRQAIPPYVVAHMKKIAAEAAVPRDSA